MARQYALVALLFCIALASAQTTTMFWTYTSRYVESISLSEYTRANSAITTYSYTTRRTVSPQVTPTATPKAASTSTSSLYDIEVVYATYAAGAVQDSDLLPVRDYSATTTSTTIDTRLYFTMPVTMTAPSTCPTAFTVTTSAAVSIPSQVWYQVTPTSTRDAGTSTGNYGIYASATWWLTAGAAPFTTTSDYYYRYYIASCSTPPSLRTTGAPRSGSGSGSGTSSSSSYCYGYGWDCGTGLRIWVIVIAAVIPALFLLGFLESWFWFRRLMRGRSAMRFGTVSWVLISLLVLCFTRMQDARSKEDQVLLEEKWKNMGSGAAFKAWWKWGFRHAYPVEHLGQFSRTTVGVVPEGQPLQPGMSQVPPPMYYQSGPPPGAPPAGPVYYYGPPPPGWIPTPDGQGFMPPQGYAAPPPQQAGYYEDPSKRGTMVSASPVSALAPQHGGQAPISPIGSTPPQPHAPQPVYPQPDVAQLPVPTPPPQGFTPMGPPPPQSASPTSHISEAPASPVLRSPYGPPPPASQPPHPPQS